MRYVIFVLIGILILKVFDDVVTSIYAGIERKRFLKKTEKQLADDSINSTIKNDLMHEGCIKRLVKWAYNFYGGWLRYKLIRLGKFPSHAYRRFILKYIYHMQLGKKVVIYGGFEIREPWNISIGDGTIIGDEAKLDGRYGIKIGSNVNFSTGVWLWTLQHDMNDEFFGVEGQGGSIVVGNHAWLSCRVTILPKVIIGEGAVVAAGAVVTKDCEPFSIYGGLPAKKLGDRNKELKYEFDGGHYPFY